MQQPDLDIPLKIGTRGSELALWQAHHVRDELRVPILRGMSRSG